MLILVHCSSGAQKKIITQPLSCPPSPHIHRHLPIILFQPFIRLLLVALQQVVQAGPLWGELLYLGPRYEGAGLVFIGELVLPQAVCQQRTLTCSLELHTLKWRSLLHYDVCEAHVLKQKTNNYMILDLQLSLLDLQLSLLYLQLSLLYLELSLLSSTVAPKLQSNFVGSYDDLEKWGQIRMTKAHRHAHWGTVLVCCVWIEGTVGCYLV